MKYQQPTLKFRGASDAGTIDTGTIDTGVLR
jgi:hypothetical protein